MSPTASPLLSDDQRDLAEAARRFAREQLHDPEIGSRDARGEFWAEGWRRCATFGLCGLPAPVEHGGGGADHLTTAVVLEALGYGCDDGGLTFSVNAHLWSAVIPLWHFGNDEQRRTYLPKLCSGEWIGLHAMTEPDSGSDAFGLRTAARREGGDYVLRGRKTLITNAPIADLFIVFAREPGTEGPFGVSAFLVEAGAKGLEVERPIEKLGLRTSPMAEILLDDVRLDESALLGKEGRGARIFMTSMQWERSLIMASALGSLERSLDEACDYARARHQFGQPIAAFQAVSDKLVDTRVALDAARALLYETAMRYDRGDADAGYAAAVKLVATDAIVQGQLRLLQVHGGYGFTRELPLERRLRDAVGGHLYSGTSDMMRRLVARSMGL